MRLAPLHGETHLCLCRQVGAYGFADWLPAEEVQLGAPTLGLEFFIGWRELHNAVAVFVAKKSRPRLSVRIPRGLKPKSRVEWLFFEIAAQRTIAAERQPFVPNQRRSHHLNFLQCAERPLQLKKPSRPVAQRLFVAVEIRHS